MTQRKVEEFRYYEMPMGRYDLALLGKSWITTYRTGEQHFHNYYEIGYCYYGEGVVFLGDKSEPYKAGTISLIPSNFPHGVHSRGGSVCRWEWLYLDFAGFVERSYQSDVYNGMRILDQITQFPIMIESEDYPGLSGVVRAILEENRQQKMLNREAVCGYMFVLLQELMRLNQYMSGIDKKQSLHIEKIRPALVYIEEHYQEEIKIKSLAEVCSISEPHFRKLFRGCMNTSPLEYINTVRIQKACDFLHKKDVSVNDLAWKVGYTSVSTFERNFKKIVGESPKQWRLKSITDQEFVSYQTKVLKGWLE